MPQPAAAGHDRQQMVQPRDRRAGPGGPDALYRTLRADRRGEPEDADPDPAQPRTGRAADPYGDAVGAGPRRLRADAAGPDPAGADAAHQGMGRGAYAGGRHGALGL